MKKLSPEERRAKFSAPVKSQVGLRSRGSRLLTSDEQQQLLDKVRSDSFSPDQKLSQLRILRESCVASKDTPDKLKLEIYKASVQGLISSNNPELLSVLKALVDIESSLLNKRQLAIAYICRGHYNDAYLVALNDPYVFEFSRALLSQDILQWHKLISNQDEPVTKSIMLLSKARMKQAVDNFSRAFRQDMSHTLEPLTYLSA